jgi:hypothetical protein
MAKVQTITYVDDLDGKEIDNPKTVTWTWLGVDYQLDVSEDNLEKIETGNVKVSKLLEVSSRVGGRKTRAGRTTSVSVGTNRETLKAIREWARNEGYDISSRGRISANIIEAFEQTH